jgi:ABC-2 type transport system permease protein
MTTATAAPLPVDALPGRVTQTNVLRSEWTKLWSLRSTRWALAAGILGLLLGIADTAFDMSRWYSLPLETRLHYKSVDNSLIGWHFAELAVGVLGVLVITGEYATGMIRSTFMAVPTRLPVLWAKVLVFATVVFALSLPVTLVDFLISSSILTQHHVSPSFSTPGALRAVIGVPLFLTVLAVFTVSLGALLRNTAAGIATSRTASTRTCPPTRHHDFSRRARTPPIICCGRGPASRCSAGTRWCYWSRPRSRYAAATSEARLPAALSGAGW